MTRAARGARRAQGSRPHLWVAVQVHDVLRDALIHQLGGLVHHHVQQVKAGGH
jgi:hypothetical protein